MVAWRPKRWQTNPNPCPANPGPYLLFVAGGVSYLPVIAAIDYGLVETHNVH